MGSSGQTSEKRRRLDELTSLLQRGDRLVVSELSRLGRSLGQIVTILDALAKAGVAFVALKENIRVEGRRDIQSKVMTTLLALFAEVERDLISERTREGLARARASGRKLGRPKGSLGVSRLDGKEDEIRRFLELGVSKTRHRQDHRRVPDRPLQLHEHPRPPTVALACIFNTNLVGTLHVPARDENRQTTVFRELAQPVGEVAFPLPHVCRPTLNVKTLTVSRISPPPANNPDPPGAGATPPCSPFANPSEPPVHLYRWIDPAEVRGGALARLGIDIGRQAR